MIESIDARLREVGIAEDDVQTRLDGKDKALVITDHDIVYADTSGLQRSGLRFVTKVITDKTGALTIRSSSGPAIEGSIRGFDVTELKVFFEGVKSAIARAKTNPDQAHAATEHTSPGHAASGHVAPGHLIAPAANLGAAAPSAHLETPAHLEPVPPPEPMPEPMLGRMHAPGPAMDPWESLSTTRPTLEMPAAPGVLPGFSDSADFGRVSPDSLDWDEPMNDFSKRSASSGFSDPLDDEPMLEPDDLAPIPASAPALASAQSAAPYLASTPEPPAAAPWSSDALDQPLPNLPGAVAPTLADHYAISPVSRWLKILAIPLGLIGIAAGALSVPATDNPSILQWLQVVGFIIGGITIALISYGIGDLLAIWASMAADVRSIRRNQTR